MATPVTTHARRRMQQRGIPAAVLEDLLDQGLLASEGPQRIMDLCDTPGNTFYFRVTGAIEGMVWGTGTYTGDSALAAAAVHAGAVKEGETAIVKVTVLAPPAQFQGSIRNGVTTHDFGRFGTAYKVDPI